MNSFQSAALDQHKPDNNLPNPDIYNPQPTINVKSCSKKKCTKRMYFNPESYVAIYILLKDIEKVHGELGLEKWKKLAKEQECFVIPGGDVSHNLPDNQIGIPYSVYEKYSDQL